MGKHPSLFELERIASGLSTMWQVPFYYSLSEFSGAKLKMTDNQYIELAKLISRNYGYLKVTEIMLFIENFKLGKYGKFYGSIDPMVITSALSEFLNERAYIIDSETFKLERQKRVEELKTAVTYEEYCRQNGR